MDLSRLTGVQEVLTDTILRPAGEALPPVSLTRETGRAIMPTQAFRHPGGRSWPLKRNSLFLRIYVSFIFFLVTPVIVLGLLFRSNLVRSYQQEVTDSRLANLTAIRDMADGFLGDARRTALELSLSSALETLSAIGTRISATNADHVFAVLDVLKLLSVARSASGRIHSLYLYSNGLNSVFTSDSEIEDAEAFRDMSWVKLIGQEMRFPFWVGPRVPVDSDKSEIVRAPYLREYDRNKVVTLVAPLSAYATNLSGAIAVNVSVEELLRIMETDDTEGDRQVYIYDASAGVVFGRDGLSQDPHVLDRLNVREIAGMEERSGYVSGGDAGYPSIVFFAKSEPTGWYYLDYDDYTSFYRNVRAVTTLVVLVCVLLVLGGIGLSYLVSRWLYNPVARLVDDIRQRTDIDVSTRSSDMAILFQAFAQLRQQESVLLGGTERGRRKLREHTLMQLLRGADDGDDLASAGLSFPHSHFLCAVASIDDQAGFERTYSREQRYYLKELVLKVASEVIDGAIAWSALQYDNEQLVFVFSLAADDWPQRAQEIEGYLREIQQQAVYALKVEMTFSLGSAEPGREGIEHSFLAAIEGLRYRLIAGRRSIIRRWERTPVTLPYEDRSAELHRVLNALKIGSEAKTEAALEEYFARIGSDAAGYYSAIQAVNLLLASTIEYLIAEHVDPAEIFGDGSHPYEQLSSLQTIADMASWFGTIFGRIIAHQDASPLTGQKYLVRLADYVDQHYTEDLSADDVASSIGVSYSYMKRLCREELRTSFHDYVNGKRIAKAKELLRSTTRTLRDIASAVGYNNDQSFARFFKKYEGITPGEYRRIR